MKATVSTQYVDGLSQQGRLMIQILVLSSEKLVASANQAATRDVHRLRSEFEKQINHLMDQRQLAMTILNNELEQLEYDYETATLRWLVEHVCREAEINVLASWHRLLRQTGDVEMAARVARVQASLAAEQELGSLETDVCPVRWIDVRKTAA